MENLFTKSNFIYIILSHFALEIINIMHLLSNISLLNEILQSFPWDQSYSWKAPSMNNELKLLTSRPRPPKFFIVLNKTTASQTNFGLGPRSLGHLFHGEKAVQNKKKANVSHCSRLKYVAEVLSTYFQMSIFVAGV